MTSEEQRPLPYITYILKYTMSSVYFIKYKNTKEEIKYFLNQPYLKLQ